MHERTRYAKRTKKCTTLTIDKNYWREEKQKCSGKEIRNAATVVHAIVPSSLYFVGRHSCVRRRCRWSYSIRRPTKLSWLKIVAKWGKACKYGRQRTRHKNASYPLKRRSAAVKEVRQKTYLRMRRHGSSACQYGTRGFGQRLLCFINSSQMRPIQLLPPSPLALSRSLPSPSLRLCFVLMGKRALFAVPHSGNNIKYFLLSLWRDPWGGILHFSLSQCWWSRWLCKWYGLMSPFVAIRGQPIRTRRGDAAA